MKKIILWCLLLGSLLWGVVACSNIGNSNSPSGPTSSATPGSTVSFTTTLYPMITGSTCLTCHSGSSPQGGLNIGTTATSFYLAMVNVSTVDSCDSLRVAPGSPSTSALINRLNFSCSPGMPETGSAFTVGQIAQWSSWIAAGAPPN